MTERDGGPVRVTVDRARCTGHGRCAARGPDVYSLDDEGNCAIDQIDVPAALAAQAYAGAHNCPERAITVTPRG